MLVGRGVPAPTGHDKTSIVCFQRQDRPGSLLGILQEFAARDVNLTKLESRPTKQGLGDYCFFIDCQGHISDEVVADALRNVTAKHGAVKFLGSYPVGGPVEAGAEQRQAVGRAVEEARGVGRRAARADPGRRRVIDLKRLRDEPEYRRGIERKRVRAGLDRRRARGVRVGAGAAQGRRAAARRAEQGVEGDRQGRARRAAGEDRGGGGDEGRPAARGRGAGRGRGGAARARAAGAEPGGDATCPTAARTTSSCSGRSATSPRRAGARPRRLRRGHRVRRHRARGGGERVALRVRHARGGAARARARATG